ncbi:MAG: ATP-binding protein [Bacteroidetes bacterium]|nr:ATP-binding protein [Bacteroidota bacterium]
MKKQIPSKTSNYAELIREQAYYIDKTKFIGLLEQLSDNYLFFLRPRRFGKSLLISMLEHYYGIQYNDQFEELFGNYYIGQPGNTTALRNSYYILSFNFSGIKTEDSGRIESEFNSEVYNVIINFLNDYDIGTETEKDIFRNPDFSSPELLRNFFTIFSKYRPSGKVYILIDEYDHFTNDLFSFNQEHFQEVVSRNGWVRKFYETIKIYTGKGIVSRFFATGVTPVTLDSMTSGFNIGLNITLDIDFHNLAGFTEAELKELILGTIYEEGKFDLDKLLGDMRAWFNGSRFSRRGGEKLYNPQLVLSFLSAFHKDYTYPEEITDNNVTSDWKKISNILSKLPKADRDYIIEHVYVEEAIEGGLSTQFNLEMPYRRADAISVLFYNGLLTIDKEEYGIIRFVIPNYVIKTIYWEYLRAVYEMEQNISFDLSEKARIFKQMASEGKIDYLVEEVSKIMEPLKDNDFQNFRESNLKMIVISILSLNRIFIIDSEREISNGRLDLLLTRYDAYDSKYQFLIEFKYLKMKDESKYEQIKNEGIAQLQRYRSSEEIKRLENLKCYLVLFSKKKIGEAFLIQ